MFNITQTSRVFLSAYYAVGGSSSFNVDHRQARPSPRWLSVH